VPPVAAAPTSSSSTPTLSSTTTNPTPPVVAEELTVLENPAIKVTFTNLGAAIKTVEVKDVNPQHKDKPNPVVLNENAHANVLQLNGWPGADSLGFQLKESSASGLTYTASLPGGVTWERSYAFDQKQDADAGMSGYLRVLFNKMARSLGQPEVVPLVYNLDVTDTLSNPGPAEVTLPAYSLSVGRAQPLLVRKHYQAISNQYLGSGWLTEKFRLITVNNFNPSTIPLIGIKTSDGKDVISSTSLDDAPLHWLGVENQFFTVLLTPGGDRTIQHAVFQCFNQRDDAGYVLGTAGGSEGKDAEGYLLPGLEPDIEASAFFPAIDVPAGKSISLSYGLYAGPKDFNRLDALGDNQGELMNYGVFSILIVPMLTVLHVWYLIFHNYGVAIILLTLMIKAITWPLQSFANRSGKRMQALAPKLKELQAKYKEQPEKLQTETFAMYRDYGVNPFGGCLPALVQMPVFFSLYFMLQNAVELRGQSFLWVHDLTQPDSVVTFALPFIIPWFQIGHFSLNLLPIMVTGLTMVMMRITPQMGDPAQAKIAQFMPLIFLFIFYNFAAALSLYYVINNCVSIIQIYRNLKKPMPELKRKPRK
jgi:YidC/Oxa1 family membrane protein insertase